MIFLILSYKTNVIDPSISMKLVHSSITELEYDETLNLEKHLHIEEKK